jgi:UDP-glucuronate 4-epimerase
MRAVERCGSVEPFRVYNLGGEHPITLAEMIAEIEQVVGRKAIIDRQPMQPGDVDRTWADLTRSKAELDYAPGTSFGQGLQTQWIWSQSLTGATSTTP